MVFAWFFHAFEAACLVMSGIGVGLSSSFLWASEGDVRHFFGGWFLDRLGLNPAGVWLFRPRAERRPELPPKLPLQLHPQLHRLHGFCMVFSWFRLYPTEADVVIPWPCTARFSWLFKRFWSCLSGDVRPLRSEGNIKTLGSFSGDGLGRLGLNPAGVCHGFALLSPVWNRLSDRTHDESGALCCSRMCGDEGVHITSVPMWLFHKFSLSAFCVCFVFCQQPSQIGPPCHIWGKHG